MFSSDCRLERTHCRRCGVPFSEPGPATPNGDDLCMRCSSRVEKRAARATAELDHAVVDGFRTYEEDFND